MAGTSRITDVYFFPNGNTAVMNSEGQQVGELQQPWLLLFAKFIEANATEALKGDLEKIQWHLPSGQIAELFKVEDDYNWRVK